MFASYMLSILPSSGMLLTVQCTENYGHINYHFVRSHSKLMIRISVDTPHAESMKSVLSKNQLFWLKLIMAHFSC